MEELTRRGLASEIRSAEALAAKESATAKCEVFSGRLAAVQAELESAKDGIYLQSANDVPYSQQQRDRLFLRRQELELQRIQETSKATQLAREIESEEKHLKTLRQFELTVPTSHVVWSTAASPRSAVTEGQTILDLANCERRFVAVELPERDFELIRLGSPAAVRFVGSNEWRQGMVQNIRGSAANSDHRLFAAAINAASPGNITVEVSLPTDPQRDERNFCSIGRLAEVRFPRDSIDAVALFRSVYNWFAGASSEKVASNASPL
jgi:multidrug resistance efflux pump